MSPTSGLTWSHGRPDLGRRIVRFGFRSWSNILASLITYYFGEVLIMILL